MDKEDVKMFTRILDDMIEQLEVKRGSVEVKRHNDILFKKISVIAEAKEKIERDWLK